MSVRGAFLDPAGPPDEAAIRATLGPAWSLWQRLSDGIGARYGVRGEPLFAGRDSGWAVRFRRSGKALLTLAPQADGGFRALVVIGPSAWQAASAVELGPVLSSAWESAKPYPDGRWLFVPVADEQTAADVERLIALKSPPPRRPRARPATARSG